MTEGSTETRVLVADDDPLARRAIATILNAEPDIAVVAEAGDGIDACARADQAADQGGVDLVLMDVRMPHQDGLDALAHLVTHHPDLPVVMLTTFSDRDAIDRALTGGAAGFLLKTAAPEELVRSIRSVRAGGIVMSPSVSRWVVGAWGPRARADVDARRAVSQLPPRQYDVLAALADGRSNAEVGETLHLSEATVKGYVSELMSALGVRNRVEAAVLFHRARRT